MSISARQQEHLIKLAEKNRKRIKINCAFCSKEIETVPYKLRITKNICCSRSCSSKFYSATRDVSAENNPNWKGGTQKYRNRYLSRHAQVCKNCKKTFYKSILQSFCGKKCSSQAKQLDVGKAAFTKVFHSYKKNALNRGLVFELSKDDCYSIMKQNCHYCGVKPSKIFTVKRRDGRKGNGPFVYNGMDRLDSMFGYTKENTVTCCHKCNRAKWDMSYEDFLNHILAMYHHNFGGKDHA